MKMHSTQILILFFGLVILILLFVYLNQHETGYGKGKGCSKKKRRVRYQKELPERSAIDGFRARPGKLDFLTGQPDMFKAYYPELQVPPGEITQYTYFPEKEKVHQTVRNFFSVRNLPLSNLNRLVLGNGATQLMYMYLSAQAKRGHKRVYVQIPYPPLYPEMISSAGLEMTTDPEYSDLEIVISPSNPDGRLQTPQTKNPKIYDFTFSSGIFPANSDPSQICGPENCLEVDQLWSVSKIFGLSGTRYGFGFISDPEIRREIEDTILLSNRGVGTVGHHIVQQIFEDTERMRSILDASSRKFQERVNQLHQVLPVINHNGYFALVEKPASWFSDIGISVASGNLMGLSNEVSRLSLAASDEDWNALIERVTEAQKNPPAVKTRNRIILPPLR